VRTKLGVAAAVIPAYVLGQYLRMIAENHPWRIAIVLAFAVVLAAGVWLLSSSRRWPTVAGIFVLGIVFGLVAGLDARDHELGSYCKYGAKNHAELERCMSHVTTDDIDKLDTHAARFARGVTSECGADSGPYCAEAAKFNTD
jgi:hypothetical protein